MMHMHVLPMAVILVQTSATCLTPAQQMHMMQNGNRGVSTASIFHSSPRHANLALKYVCNVDSMTEAS